MLSVKVSDKALLSHPSDAYILCIEADAGLAGALQDCAQKCAPHLGDVLRKADFKGTALSTFTMPIQNNGEIAHLVCVGLGKKGTDGTIDIETFRRAIAKAVKAAAGFKAATATCVLPDASLFGVSHDYLVQQAVIIAHMTLYHYVDYVTDASRHTKPVELTLVTDAARKTETEKSVEAGMVIARAVNQARFWVDTPPSDLTPAVVAHKAEEIGKACGLKTTIFSEPEIIKMGMGGLAGVSRGSDQDCKFVIMEYVCGDKNAPTVAFVGKGITFDSGGLSIKPADSMESMKDDMSGAAAVICTMQALSKLKPNINVIGLAPLSENLPSGKATKPGDILRFYNGKTAEVRNTDAEGRLILADALSYAVKHYKPDAIIDLATLTGACSYALGPFFAGLMSQHDELTGKVEKAAQTSGDRVWRLPLHDDYKTAVVSDIADICNIGKKGYRAGAITAAHFLKHFVDDVPWVHLDIAGTAFDVPDMPYYRPGATGFGVRLLVDLAMHWKK